MQDIDEVLARDFFLGECRGSRRVAGAKDQVANEETCDEAEYYFCDIAHILPF